MVHRSHHQFERLVAAIPDAVVVTDHDCIVHFVNDAARDLFGKGDDDVIGKTFGFPLTEGEASEIEVLRGGEKRPAEMRVVACEWNSRPALLALIRDMTGPQQMRDGLRQAQKMEVIGAFAGGVAHDFNNLLLVMLIYADMVRAACAQDDPRLADILEVTRSIESAQALARQLFALSTEHPMHSSIVHLNDVAAGIHTALRATWPADVEITTIVDDEVWPVLADREQIEHVIMTLAANAKNAMSGRGRVTLQVENRTMANPDHSIRAGDYVSIRVSDNGSGIDSAHLDRIFEPFFATKERGRGTGLGLAACYATVARAGGTIVAQSDRSHGTSFTILLPRTGIPCTEPAAQRAGDVPNRQ